MSYVIKRKRPENYKGQMEKPWEVVGKRETSREAVRAAFNMAKLAPEGTKVKVEGMPFEFEKR